MVAVGIVGVGGMGRTHLNNLKSMENVCVDAICDANPAVAGIAEEIHAGYFNDLHEMLNQTAAEIILVCTPTFLHAPQIEAILRSKRHCISEKPLCLTAARAVEMFALAKEMGVHLYVAQVLHFTEEYRLLERLIRSQQYGRVCDAFFYRLTKRPAWLTDNWMFDPQKSGLIPYDLHIHELDFIISLFGKSVTARRQRTACGEMQRDHYRFLYDYGDKTVCAEASWYRAGIPFTHGYRLCFERAVVTCDGTRVIAYEQDEDAGKTLWRAEACSGDTAINVSSARPYREELEHFLTCVAQNRASDIVKNENVLAVLETLESMESPTSM